MISYVGWIIFVALMQTFGEEIRKNKMVKALIKK